MTDRMTPFGARPSALRALLVAALLAISLSTDLALAGEKAAYAIGVDGLACPFCAYGIEKQLGQVEGVQSVSTEIASGKVIVTMKEGATLERSMARKAVENAGFTLRSFEETSSGKAGER